MNIATLCQQEFELDESLCYLNHAAVAPWPHRTAKAVHDFANENVHLGSKNYLLWLEIETELRRRLAALINAPDLNDIALLKNTSEALSVVAYGLEWKHGDNIVISTEEFPSNRIVWESLQQYGVELRRIDLHRGGSPEQSLIDAFDSNTRLLAISSVQYASGLRMNLEHLGQECQKHNILFCVDAIQSVGALQFDVQQIQADFVMADGHKWMLGPEGLALFYCRAELRDTLHLRQFGWHMVEQHNDFDRLDWQPARSARRFECGSPNMLAIHALNASISLLQDAGMAQVEARVLENTQALFAMIAASRNLSAITRDQPDRIAGIVTFKHRGMDPTTLFQHLQNAGVMCAQRGGGVRFSPHFYTPVQVLERAVNLADQGSAP